MTTSHAGHMTSFSLNACVQEETAHFLPSSVGETTRRIYKDEVFLNCPLLRQRVTSISKFDDRFCRKSSENLFCKFFFKKVPDLWYLFVHALVCFCCWVHSYLVAWKHSWKATENTVWWSCMMCLETILSHIFIWLASSWKCYHCPSLPFCFSRHYWNASI